MPSAATDVDGIQLTASDKRQLEQKVAEDLGPRYGMSKDKTPSMMGGRKGFPSKSLFDTRLIVARDPSGEVVGCAGIEAALYEASQGNVFRSDQADRLVRNELDVMEKDEAKKASEVYIESGIGALAKGIIEKQFNEARIRTSTSGSRAASRQPGRGTSVSAFGPRRALCDACERCIVDEWKMDEIALQVEEANTAAIAVQKDGYRDVFRAEDATALRLQPAEPNVFSSLPGPFSALAPENEELLKEVTSPTVTMAKPL